ncbi:MAG: UDP binding domain-containing protein, partial [Candidatus Bathyarchaeia archaeon]
VSLLAKRKAPLQRHDIETKLRSHVKTSRINATEDVKKAVSQSDIILITEPVKISEKKKPNYSSMEKLCKSVGSNIRPYSLLIVASLVGSLVLDEVFRRGLEMASGFKAGTNFGLAFSPASKDELLTTKSLINSQRIVAAFDKASLEAASTILGTIFTNLRKTHHVKEAELAFLFGNVQKTVSNALASELASFCEKAHIDYWTVLSLAQTQEPHFLLFPQLVEESQEEVYLLLEDAETLGLKLRIASIANEAGKEAVKHAVALTGEAMKCCGKPLRTAKVSLLGLSQIPNARSFPKKGLIRLVELLKKRGARVSLYDPYLQDFQITDMQINSARTLTEAIEGKDCLIIATAHDQFKNLNLKKLRLMMKMPAAMVDLEGVFEPSSVEKEGLLYRGIGRGVWTR